MKRKIGVIESVEDKDYVPESHALTPYMPKVKNKQNRARMYAKLQRERERLKKKMRLRKRKLEQEEGKKAEVKRPQRTIDNTREKDETMVTAEDVEVFEDEDVDEFAPHYDGKVIPRVLLTTSQTPSRALRNTMRILRRMIPESEFYRRRAFEVKDMVKYAQNRGYTESDIFVTTALLIWEETNKDRGLDSLIFINLPDGPTAHFRVSNVLFLKQIRGHGKATAHYPELILNNFNTRLGHTVARMLGSLFPQKPDFTGRKVVTFHNQRDFLFFRQHRYIFDSTEKVRLQELGPRFTLKLLKLQHGTFDTKYGEYEFIQKKEMMTSRRRFFL